MYFTFLIFEREVLLDCNQFNVLLVRIIFSCIIVLFRSFQLVLETRC